MFERDISEDDVEDAILNGKIIEKYPNDTPYPSFLVLKEGKKPLHVVYAKDILNKQIIVITAYNPSKDKLNKDFTKRIKKWDA